jgi:hypothetical protein
MTIHPSIMQHNQKVHSLLKHSQDHMDVFWNTRRMDGELLKFAKENQVHHALRKHPPFICNITETWTLTLKSITICA